MTDESKKGSDDKCTHENDNPFADADWQTTEYEQLSEDLRHFTIVGWQSLIAVLALDAGLVLAVFAVIGATHLGSFSSFSTGEENMISFLILLAGSVASILMGMTEFKWNKRSKDRICRLRSYDRCKKMRRFYPREDGFRMNFPVGDISAIILFVVGVGLFLLGLFIIAIR